LVRGQLAYLIDSGIEVSVGTRMVERDNSPFDPGVEAHHIDFVRQPSPLADLRALWQTIQLIRRLRPDIVHASTPKAGLLGMIAARLCRVRIRVFQVRGLRYETEVGYRRRLFRFLERTSIALGTHVFFNSNSSLAIAQRDHLIEPGNVIVLGSSSGVDATRFTPITTAERMQCREEIGLPLDAQVIVFVGRLTKDKGTEDLVDVFTSPDFTTTGFTNTGFTSGEGDGFWLLLVGTFEDGDRISPSVRRTIAEHPRIVHHPWMDDTRRAYATADVLAFPSYREGLPNGPLQAQACGIPVVAYAATGTVDAVVDGETGILVPVGDRKALRHALLQVLEDEELRLRLAHAGREHVVTHFQPHKVWEQMVDIFRRALDDR
jgi:glycosyltransferase involved in cell wall biosynthesis